MARWVKWNNPTIKPPFGAQIDWSNPITEGLVGCWLFNELQGNICNLANPTEKGILYSDTRWISDSCYFDGDNDYIITNTLTPISPPFSVITEIDCQQNGNSCEICGATMNEGKGWGLKYEQYRDTGKVGLTKYGVVDITSTLSSPVGKSTVDVIVTDTFCNFFVNGLFNKISDNNSINIPSDKRFVLGIYYRNGQLAGDLLGKIYKIYLFSRALSDLEIEQLHYEPYSFFLYPQYWYLVDFGGTGATKVSSDFTALFDIFAKVQSGLTVLFDIYEKVQSDLTNIFSIYNVVQSNLTCIFDVNGRVQSDIIALFDIGGRVSSEVTLTFDVLNRIGSNLTGIFKILNKTQSDLGGVFDIYNLVQSDFTALFDVYNLTNSEITILYDMAGRVKSDLELLFNILANVDKSKWPWNMLPWNKLPWGKSPWKEE